MPEDSNIVAWKTERLCLMAEEDKKKLICGMEGENVVAYGRLPSPSPANSFFKTKYLRNFYLTVKKALL